MKHSTETPKLVYLDRLEIKYKLGVVEHTHNPRTLEADAGESL